MLTTTTRWCSLAVVFLAFMVALPAQAQRTVTLTLNTATTADTIRTDSFVEVRGAVKGVAPITLFDGNVIDWSDASTLEPTNIGGDYWQVQFQIADTTELTFKFYSQQLQDGLGEGWEADPNPVIAPGSNDTTLTVHFFESQREYCYEGQTPTECASGDRGEYGWRPYESKQDSVAVWYRVAMFGAETENDGYDRDNPTHRAGVTGENLFAGHVFDWGTSWKDLTRESTNKNAPGYDIFSGVVYYPTSLAGTMQQHKFILVDDGGIVDWEEGNVPSENRRFVIPAQDTTIAWVYYGDTPPTAQEPVTGDVVFTVDLTPLEQVGLFDKARGDTLQVMGSFNGWDWGDRVDVKGVLDPIPGQLLFERVQTLTLLAPNDVAYKYIIWFDSTEFHNDLGYAPPGRIQNEGTANAYFAPLVFEEPLSKQGGNRTFTYTGATELELQVDRFNDVLDGNIIPAGTSIDVTWSVDMTQALSPGAGASNSGDAFVPGTDKVMLQANGDLIWAVSQGYPRRANGTLFDADTTFAFSAESGNVYAGTKTITGPTYSAVQYLYAYGTSQNDKFAEQEGSFTGGRRRTRFIQPNPDGSWPATYSFPAETFQPDGDKPFETNPAIGVGVEPVGGELPQEISLSQNFPNPFNPTTTFEYTISAAQQVDLFVYDIIGRRVATLVSGLQPANTYKVSFDASTLASGTYFYRLETADKVITRSMVLLK